MAVNRKNRQPKIRRRKKRSANADQFVAVYHKVIKSEAWRNCSGDAIKVFMYLCSLYHGKNNGELAASMRDIGKACGFTKDRANRSINELLDWALIEIVTRGSYGGRKANEYGIMMFDCHATGRPAVIRWEPRQSH